MLTIGGEPYGIDEVDGLDLPLNILTAEIEKIGRIIDAVRAQQSAHVTEWPVDDADELVAKAQAIYRFRRRRDRLFDDYMFADPR